MDSTHHSYPLTGALKALHERVSTLEVLVANLYGKYYQENYGDSACYEAKRSLHKAQKADYRLYSNYCSIDNGYEDRVQTLVSEFFNHLDSIISMATTSTNSHLPLTLGSNHETVNWNTPTQKQALQEFVEDHMAAFAGYTIEQIDQLQPASDLVLRIWLGKPTGEKRSFIMKTLGNNPVRNDIAEKYGLFYREMTFYSAFSSPLTDYTPECYYSSPETHRLVMEDKGQAVMGDQLYGYVDNEAASVIETILGFHRYWFERPIDAMLPRVNDPEITAILPEMLMHAWSVTKPFLNHPNNAKTDHIIEELATNLQPISDELSKHATLVHGDLRMENLLFEHQKLHAIVDWQLLAIGSPMIDVAYFLMQSGSTEERVRVEDDLLSLYADKFSAYSLTKERVRFEYDLASKHSLIIPIMGAAWDLQELSRPRDIVVSAFDRTIRALY